MHQTFDWIFFGIVGIPFVLGFADLFMPNLVEKIIRGPATNEPSTNFVRPRDSARR